MPTLYVVGMPLDGIFKDLTVLAKEAIAKADIVIGEERKSTHRVLAAADARGKEYFLLNEHSKSDDFSLIDEIMKVESACLFSDAGTPCVADPGYNFVDQCHKSGIEVLAIPGPSSITSALSVSGFYSESFYFAGFPPRKDQHRKGWYDYLLRMKDTVVFLERPYSLAKVIADLKPIKRRLCVSFNIGLPEQQTFRGRMSELAPKIENMPKAPFVVVIEGTKG